MINQNELVALLELALRYISHPEVQAIPFALPASAVQERIEEALAKAGAVVPSRQWLTKMAAIEDECGSVSVGGLAVDVGLPVAPLSKCCDAPIYYEPCELGLHPDRPPHDIHVPMCSHCENPISNQEGV